MRIDRIIKVPQVGDGYALEDLLDAYLENVCRESVQEMLEENIVTTISGSPLSATHTVRAQDTLHLDLARLYHWYPPPLEPGILFEDDTIVVVNKPANMLVHPAGGLFQWTLIDQARVKWCTPTMDLCHRLDRETSGVVIMAKTRSLSTHIKMQFEERRILKRYIAYVRGIPSWNTYECNAPIAYAPDDRRTRRKVDPSGLAASTSFRVMNIHEHLTEVECAPFTGRSHQIRVHLAHLGFPILGDALYGSEAETKSTTLVSTRHALHCAHMCFRNHEGYELSIRAPIPNDMLAFLGPTVAR